jgi:hypothetical protein
VAWPQGAMLIGGLDAEGVISARTDVYDRRSNAWKRGPDLSQPRFALAAVSLDDGRVLVVGGKNDPLPSFVTAQPTTELIDPETGMLELAPPMPIGRQFHRAVRLDDGRALVAGGVPSDGADTRVLLFEPTTNVWDAASTAAGVATGPGTAISAASNGAWIADGKGVHFFDADTHAFTAAHTFDPAHELKQPLMTRLGDGFVIADHVANVGVGDDRELQWFEYTQSIVGPLVSLEADCDMAFVGGVTAIAVPLDEPGPSTELPLGRAPDMVRLDDGAILAVAGTEVSIYE